MASWALKQNSKEAGSQVGSHRSLDRVIQESCLVNTWLWGFMYFSFATSSLLLVAMPGAPSSFLSLVRFVRKSLRQCDGVSTWCRTWFHALKRKSWQESILVIWAALSQQKSVWCVKASVCVKQGAFCNRFAFRHGFREGIQRRAFCSLRRKMALRVVLSSFRNRQLVSSILMSSENERKCSWKFVTVEAPTSKLL